MPCFLKTHTFRIFVGQVRSYSKSQDIKLNYLLKNMPKVPKHIPDAQKQRKRIKEKFSKYVPGRVTLQVLGTGADGAPRSLYVFSDQSRYLFNCGEGTQRLAHEHKMKLAKLEHIFITQAVWKNMGGLPGTALTIQDVGVPKITLHGPKGLEELFTATKRFVVIKDLEIQMAECKENVPYEDNVMTVQYVPILKSSIECEVDSFDSSDLDERDKSIQISINSKDESTSTRSEKRKNRRRSRSRSQHKHQVLEEDDTDYYAHERKRKKSKSRNRHNSCNRSRSPSESGKRTAPETISESSRLLLSENKELAVSMAFICRLQPRPGALNLEKCVAFGVPPGPILGKLKAGQDVTLNSGVVVKSTDVCEPDDPGPLFIVIDCPSEDYLESLTKNEIFKNHQASAKREEDLAYLVVHFTPKHVMEHPKYKKWVDDFSPSTQHLVLNDANTCMGSVSVHRIQYKLNLLTEELFPLLGDKGTQIVDTQLSGVPASKKFKSDENLPEENGSLSETISNTSVSSAPSIENLSMKSRPSSPVEGLIQANTFCNFHLRPRQGLDRTSELKLCPSEYISETTSVQGFPDLLQELKLNLLETKCTIGMRPYPRIVFLGTGSCIPNKTRNTSGILIQINENLNLIVDCGEGTYGQIVRFFGPENADEVLANVNGVYVSHLHADHHIGLIGLLQGRRKAIDRLKLEKGPVLLMAPKQILTWLNFYEYCFENIEDEYELVSNQDLMNIDDGQHVSIKERIKDTLEMSKIQTVYVRHCPNAFGVAFRHRSGYKITYSGDTMPSENLINLGMHSDLLIHEATMEDELANEAIVKMHSTTSQAIEVGQKMQAKYILLTHFSQRYAKLPRFNDNFKENVGIAFDNMQIRLDELPLVPLLYPALKTMFAEHYEELEHKAVKRQLRIEREREASRERQKSVDG